MVFYGSSLLITALLISASAIGVQQLVHLLSGLGDSSTVARHYVTTISLGGMIGGIVSSFLDDKDRRVLLSSFSAKDGTMRLGLVGDLWIGLTAAYALFFLISGVYDIPNTTDDVTRTLKLFGLAIAAGVAGKVLLARLPDEVNRRINQLQKENEATQEETQLLKEETARLKDEAATLGDELRRTRAAMNAVRSMDLAEAGDLDGAEIFLEQAWNEDPESPDVLHGMAYLRKRQGRIAEAIELCTKAIELAPKREEEYYNRACYKALLGQPVDDVLEDLRQAIQLNPENKALALNDPDFSAQCKNHPKFGDLTRP